jgi:large-conductance mechanosensitive channel
MQMSVMVAVEVIIGEQFSRLVDALQENLVHQFG